MKTHPVRISFRCQPEDAARLFALADELDASVSWLCLAIIRRALADFAQGAELRWELVARRADAVALGGEDPEG